MRNELSKNDQERITEAKRNMIGHGDSPFSAFVEGAKYEHPIARKEGFNEAIEEVKGKLNELFGYKIGEHQYATVNKKSFFEEINKLKNRYK